MIHQNGKAYFEETTCPRCGERIYVRYQRTPLRILGLADAYGVITNAKSNPDIDTIYNFWNSQHIVTHRAMTPDMARAIRAELKNYSEEEILQSIRNYAEIQKGEQYWFKYAWTLRDFLKRGIAKFLDLETAKQNYSKKDIHSKLPKTHKFCQYCGYKGLTAETYCPKCNNRLDKDYGAGKYGHLVKH